MRTTRISIRSKTHSIKATWQRETTTSNTNMVICHFYSGEQIVRAVKRGDDSDEDKSEIADSNGRITKGPFTLKNGAVYTG